MPLRTIALALTTDSDPDPTGVVRYALDMAARDRAHLIARIGVPTLLVPTLGYLTHGAASQMQALIEQEDIERRRRAEQLAQAIRSEGERLGVIASVEVLSAAYDPLTPHLMRAARVSDLCIMLAPSSNEPQQRDVLVDMLFGSGAPLLLVPPNWNKLGPIRKAIVAWDGGVPVARAVRDALPLLASADSVEVVSVLGEKEISAEVAGSDIARHLARHCRNVSVNLLPVGEHGVAATLAEHAATTQADLMVMGGYGHSRLREFILGGVTRDTLMRADIPTLLAH